MPSEAASRRSFLTSSLAGITAAASSTAAGQQNTPMSGPIRMGIVGAGIRGLEVMQYALEAGARIVAVCDLYDGHLRRAKEIQPNTPTTKDYREIVSRNDIDAVIV